ncbi:hypothetical protein E24_00031 [Faustovirus]|nr:hypothetical protein PRJ_Fausto_00029 [Faustovirus]AMN82966.1 hypothetical protein E24_00031 [Faustovirus]AMN83953.1 hypothetical protein D5a_00031 [Faustovirus]AMN84937.1 hypothetical protein E23_00031 [Faustovirus]QBR98923.1 hypothetical protein [Faustovirus mariensis]
MNIERYTTRGYYTAPNTIIVNANLSDEYYDTRAKLSIVSEAYMNVKTENDKLNDEVKELKTQIQQLKEQLEQQESRVVELQLINDETTKRFSAATADLEIKNKEFDNLINLVAKMDLCEHYRPEKNTSVGFS